MGPTALLALLTLACSPPPIKVGVLHSRTGPLEVSEGPVMRTTLAAIRQLNAEGGVLGRPVEAVLGDGASDERVFAQEADRLLDQEQVQAVFGCWTSASRKATLEVVERHDGLLLYPVFFEGLERSDNAVYVAALPNQQVLPGLRWMRLNHGRRAFFVGSDYVYPRATNAVVRAPFEAWQGELVAEPVYVPIGRPEGHVEAIAAQIADLKPDFILNTINGEDNRAMVQALRDAGVTAEEVPTLYVGISTTEIDAFGVEMFVGDRVVSTWFPGPDLPNNHLFELELRAALEQDVAIGEPMVQAWNAIQLWAEAVELAGSAEPEAVRQAMRGLVVDAPGGMLYVDANNLHGWFTPRLGSVRPDGSIKVEWDAGTPVRPAPFPQERTPEEWEGYLNELWAGWGESWAAP